MQLTGWQLPTGRMVLNTDGAARYRVADILDLGARQNPRRPFVFVSRVLGKHIPCAPSVMRDVQASLAAELGPEPALFIGMAETATGLGEGVYSAWSALTGATAGLYIATTRYPIDGREALNFTEAHSHATALKLYLPKDDSARRTMASVRRAVLVDDEISTGNTFASLVGALREQAPQLSRIDVVALTDFSGGQVVDRLRSVTGVKRVRVHALLSGSFEFTPSAGKISSALPAQREVSCRRSRMMAATARCAITQPLQLPEALVRKIAELVAGKSLRLIATGEFMYPVQLLGERLEAQGCPVLLQSTTRSPLMVGGAIGSVHQVSDPYGEGVANYIYNLPGSVVAECESDTVNSKGEIRIIAHETGDNPEVRHLGNELQAMALDMGSGQLIHPGWGLEVA